jgi:hypothetical protein
MPVSEHSPQEPRIVKGFADFAEPFCAGWNAHRAHGDADPETFTKALMEAFENSGSQRAFRVFEAMQAARNAS